MVPQESVDKDLQTMPHTFPQLGKELMLHQQPHHRALVGAMIPAHRPPQLNNPLTSLKTPSNTLRKHDKTLANQFKSLKHVKTCWINTVINSCDIYYLNYHTFPFLQSCLCSFCSKPGVSVKSPCQGAPNPQRTRCSRQRTDAKDGGNTPTSWESI